MRRLSDARFLAEIEIKPCSSVYALESRNGKLTVLADIEEWMSDNWPEDKDYSDDPYRIELYEKGDWSLDPDTIIDDMHPDPLSQAVMDARGINAGGICFAHEEDRKTGRKKESVKEAFLTVISEDCAIFEVSGQEFAAFCDVLADGVYVFCIVEERND